MNSAKMNEILSSMARDSDISMNVCTGVIASINSIYMQSISFYEQDSIAVFENFLSNGVLNFADHNIQF